VTETGFDPTIGLAGQLRLFAAGARLEIHRPDIATLLLANSAAVSRDLSSIADRTEFFWFLHSQKAWIKLLEAARAQDDLGDLPLHVADLCWLAFYRGQMQRLLAGTDREGFGDHGGAFLEFIRDRWPLAADRHAFYGAMIEHITGAIEPAREFFQGFAPGGPLVETLAAVHTVLPARPAPAISILPEVEVVRANARHVALVSLDRVYFDKYARLVAGKFFENNPGNGLHFHCVGFDPAALVREWNLSGAIGWTTDLHEPSELTPRNRRGYYAAARYIYLARYLALYESVFVADADGLVLRDVAEVAAEHSDHDIVLSTRILDPDRRLNRLPWEAVPAGLLLARATPGSVIFAEAVGSYLTRVMHRAADRGMPFWYADQSALYYTWRDLMDAVHFAKFSAPVFKQVGSWKLFQGEAERLQFLGA
jgi:hypothetical protein